MLVELVLFLVLVFVLWQYVSKKYERFDGTSVPFVKPVLLIGNLWRGSFKRIHILDDINRLYNDVGDERCRYIGLYNLTSPIIMLKDPEIIKQITVKDFDYFGEHDNQLDEEIEPLMTKTLVALKGEMWREMRAALSPAFTSSKIKDMLPLIAECGKQINDYLKDESKGESGPKEMKIRELTTRFMTDVIATTAFGIRVDSFKEKKNEFFEMGSNITRFSTLALLKIIFISSFPKLAKMFKMRMFSKKMDAFFRTLIVGAMKHREENNIVRRDLIQLLIEAKQGSLKSEINQQKDAGFATVEESEIGTKITKRVWSENELVAQAVLFFLAGFETASTLMSFLLFEIALNPNVQEKLQEEIDGSIEENGDKVTYEMIQKMKYLDMVVSEGLRKWPPAGFTDRKCNKNIDIGPIRYDEEESYIVKKNETVWLPIYSLHMDPKYYPDPSKFDPERFSEENKDNIKPFTYLPFGAGPRNCIASRFALLEAKVMLYYLVSEFNIEAGAKTKTPLVLDTSTFSMRIPDGYTLKFVPRKSETSL